MYAVVSKKAISYLGHDKEAALTTLKANPGSGLVEVTTLSGLAKIFESCAQYDPTPATPLTVSDMVEQILEELEIDPAQAKDWMRHVSQQSKQTMTDLRVKADKGLRAVGEELAKIADLLKKEKTPNNSNDDEHEIVG